MQKTILLLVTFFAMTSAAIAQQGSVLLYGNIGILHTKNSGDVLTTPASGTVTTEQTDFNLAPGIGYQFSSHWTIGAALLYDYLHTSYVNSTLTPTTISGHSSEFSAGPFVRYTYAVNTWIGFYGQAQAVYSWSSPAADKSIDAAIYPAVYIEVKNGLRLNFSFGGLTYDHTTNNTNDTKGDSFNLNFGSAASIGLSKNFGGKKHVAS